MNILLIHSDQHRYDCIRAHGLREVDTPNLDRLCGEGTTFSQAFSTIPVCTPARASLLTGVWPHQHGCTNLPTSEMNRPARRELPTVFQVLNAAGYRTGWVGKYHQELETDAPGVADGVDVFVPHWAYHQERKNRNLPPVGKPNGWFGEEDRITPPEGSSPAWQADRVCELLERESDRPFFLRWDPPEPHLPCHPLSAFAARCRAEDIPPWRSFPDSLDNKPAVQKRQRRLWGVENWTWAEWQPHVRLYYAMITELDHHIGRVLETLDRLNLTDETLVIYSSDHGDFCGGHGQMDKHFNLYDDIVRVPLILRRPGYIPAGKSCGAFASNEIDLARTLLEAAGVDVPEHFAGEDLIGMANGAAPRSCITSQYFGTETGAYSMRMIRDRAYKFVYHPVGDMHELYDLRNDPGERENLINDPAAADVLAQLKSRLWEEMKAQGDPLANAWTFSEFRSTEPE
jgi:arylsulfatase A-like enzyme